MRKPAISIQIVLPLWLLFIFLSFDIQGFAQADADRGLRIAFLTDIHVSPGAASEPNLENIVTESWGNRACIKANWPRWQVYQSWRHSLKNEPEYPIVVWALARK